MFSWSVLGVRRQHGVGRKVALITRGVRIYTFLALTTYVDLPDAPVLILFPRYHVSNKCGTRVVHQCFVCLYYRCIVRGFYVS